MVLTRRINRRWRTHRRAAAQASANAADGVTLGSSQYRKPGALSNLATLLKFRMTAHYKDGQFMGTRFGDKIMFSVLILSLCECWLLSCHRRSASAGRQPPAHLSARPLIPARCGGAPHCRLEDWGGSRSPVHPIHGNSAVLYLGTVWLRCGGVRAVAHSGASAVLPRAGRWLL